MKIIKWAVFSIISVVFILLLSMLLLQHGTLFTINHGLQKPAAFCVFRYAILVTLLIGWPYWIRLLGRCRDWEIEFTEAIIQKRWQAMSLLIAMEALIWWSHS